MTTPPPKKTTVVDKGTLLIEQKPPHLWICAGLLVVLLVSILGRDMGRPFSGLHSWAEASGAWAARSHVNYGLAYTKGASTWAVGNPPAANPQRYMDHPQLAVLTLAAFMKIFGTTEFSYRLLTLFMSIATLLIVWKLFKAILDDKTAIVASLLYVLFPLTSYFGTGGTPNLFGFLAIYAYFAATASIEVRGSKRFYMIVLAASLFLAIQYGWMGFFFAFAIGADYVLKSIFRRKMPDWGILSILVIAPLSSMLLNFIVMAGGYNWDINKIIELYKWRSAKGEMPEFLWGAWFAKLWEFAVTNFTTPVLIIAILYFILSPLLILGGSAQSRSARFLHLLLFLILPASQLLILKGGLWRHQIWEYPLSPLIAIAAAKGIMALGDLLAKLSKKLSIAAIVTLIAVITGFCVAGTTYYYNIRWQPDAKIQLFKTLNQTIPPDKALLSFEDFIVNQHSSKGGFYRPEIAWYLDRDIVQATTFEQVEQLAQTGRFPVYLVPVANELSALIDQLRQKYQYEYVPGDPGEQTKDGRFLKAGMYPYMIFDLKSKQ